MYYFVVNIDQFMKYKRVINLQRYRHLFHKNKLT